MNTLNEAIREIQDYSERRMRTAIEELPDGTYSFAHVLDDDGQGNEDVRIHSTVSADGDPIVVDFDGTDPQIDGPINTVFTVTASATYYAIRCLTDPDIPPNVGCYRPIDIDAPSGTVVNASPPAAVVGGTWKSHSGLLTSSSVPSKKLFLTVLQRYIKEQ